MKTTLLTCIAAVAVLVTAARGADADQLQGTWVVVSAEMAGKSSESSKGDKFTFTGDKVVIENKVMKAAPTSFKIDATTNPKQIDIADKTPQKGIYQLDGDKLKLCYGNKRPASFDSTAGLLLAFKRQKP